MKYLLSILFASSILAAFAPPAAGDCTDFAGGIGYVLINDINNPCTIGTSVTITDNGDPTINGSGRMTIDGSLTFTGQSIFTMNTSDSVIIENDFSTGSNGDLVIDGGVLWVKGNMNISGNASFGVNGIVLIGGNLSISGVNADVSVDGGFAVGGTADLGTNDLAIGDDAVFVAESLSTSGNVDIGAGGTIYVENGLDGVTGTVTNDPANADQDCSNNCCGDLCNAQGTSLSGAGAEVLPITLTRFSAYQESNTVNIAWTTATELNFEKFELYKLTDSDRKLIGIIGSTGNSNGDSYSFADLKPNLGLNIYQLRSVDYDGYTEWFSPISIVFQPADVRFEVYPNPARTYELETSIYEAFGLQIYSLNGGLIFEDRIENSDLASLPSLTAGLYIFRYNVNGYIASQRVIIQD